VLALTTRLWAGHARQDLAQELKSHWRENPAPKVHFELKEAEREKRGATTHVAYHLETSGFPVEKSYTVWMKQSGDQKIVRFITGYSADASGKLVCPPESQPTASNSSDLPIPCAKLSMPLEQFPFGIRNYHKGEALDLALVSTDGTVRAFAHAYPFPIWAQDGKCSLTVELQDPEGKFFTVLGEGFDLGEKVKISATSGKEIKEDSQQASPDGQLRALLAPRVIGKESGFATFTAIGNSCHPTVTFEWGKRAMKIQ